MATPITNLQEVIGWLRQQRQGDDVTVSKSLFEGAFMVEQLFSLLPSPEATAIPLTNIKIDIKDLKKPTLTGRATMLEEADTTCTFTFSEQADSKNKPLLLADLTCAFTAGDPWPLLENDDGESEIDLNLQKPICAYFTANAARQIVYLTFKANVQAGKNGDTTIPVIIAVPPYDGDWVLAINTQDPAWQNSLDSQGLASMLGNQSIGDILPSELTELRNIKLQTWEMSCNVRTPSCSYIKMAIDYDKTWSFFSNKFSVSNPTLTVEVINPLVDQRKPTFQASLRGQVRIGATLLDVGGQFIGHDKAVYAQLAPESSIHLGHVFKFFQLKLPQNFADSVEIDTLAFILHTAQDRFDFKLGTSKPIRITDRVSLERCFFDINGQHDNGNFTGSGVLASTFTIAGIELSITAQYKNDQGVTFKGSTGPGQQIHIGDLISDLVTKFGVDNTLPQPIAGIVIENLHISYNTSTKAFSFGCNAQFPINNDQKLDIIVNIAIEKENDTYNKSFSGRMTIGKLVFNMKFSQDTSAHSFAATYSHTGDTKVLKMRQDLIQPISPTIAELVPHTLEVDLDKIAWGISKPSGGSTLFFFGLAIDTPVDLANLPIIDNVLSAQERLALQKLQVLIASEAISKDLAAVINALIDNDYPQVPADGMTKGVNLGVQLQVGQDSTPFLFPMSTASQSPNRNSAVSQPTRLVAVPTQPSSTTLTLPQSTAQGVTWLSLQKNFGPLYFDKIGLQYSDSYLFVLLNVSATASALTLSLDGFGVGIPIKGFKPSFTLDGVGITYASGPVEISGALQGTFDPVKLTGEVLVETEILPASGLGGYLTVDNRPSMFLYSVLDYPIGGPSFFFIKGLAAGLGFNGKLLLPAINGVANFPFVRWAQGLDNPPIPDPNQDIGDQVKQVLQALIDQGIVAPELGSDWLAVGIRFTSFEMVDSFALLAVVLGTDVEIDLLGLSTLSLPVGATTPVAYAELALQASFSTKSELLAIQGQLTNSSYVLSKDCHLIGGFAFYAWFSEEHAGDFVITLGGYNPHYTAPARYPTVPRLGINWQVTDKLAIKGREYFALTPNAIMAGGFLEAVWHSGGIKAWFSVEADFLMMWKPLHYAMQASVDIGASFTIHLLFTSINMTIHVGVGLHIWGPDFAGKATVHLAIISFTLSFGSSSQHKPKTISWNDFVQQLIPQKQPADNTILLADDAATSSVPPDVCQITVAKGLIKQLSNEEDDLNWVVNAEKLELITQSIIPSKTWYFSDNVQLADEEQPPDTQKIDFGVRPVGISSTDFTSKHTITLTSTESSTLCAIKNYDNVPKGLWDHIDFDSHGNPELGDPVNDTTLKNVLTGFTLKPCVQPPAHTLPIDLAYLQYTIDKNIQYYLWSVPYVPTQDGFKDETVATTIQGQQTAHNRPKLLAAIITNGLIDQNIDIDVSELASVTHNDLLAQPALRLLGEEKA